MKDLYPMQKRTNGDLTSGFSSGQWATHSTPGPTGAREACAGRQMTNTETQVTWSGTGTRLLQASASLLGHYFWSPFLFWSPTTIRWEHSARLLPILLGWGRRTMSLMPHSVYLQHPAQPLPQSKGSINIYRIMTFLTSAVLKDFKKDVLMIDVW